MHLKNIGETILYYFDLDREYRKKIANTSAKEAFNQFNELEERIKESEERRSNYSLGRKFIAYFNLNEPSLWSLRHKRDFYKKIYESKQ